MESSRRDLQNDVAEHRPILKTTKIRITPLFFNIELCSATSIESSRRALFNDMPELRPILKNNQITHHPRFSFTPKTGISFPNRCFVLIKFYVVHLLCDERFKHGKIQRKMYILRRRVQSLLPRGSSHRSLCLSSGCTLPPQALYFNALFGIDRTHRTIATIPGSLPRKSPLSHL